MNKIIIYLGVAILIIFSSCEKVIDLNLDSVSPQIAIQGNIYDQPGPYSVKISKTVDFYESSIYPPVAGALVIISDDHGVVDTLVEKSPGEYITTKIVGNPGYTYSLVVTVEEISYTATSTMNNAVYIDSVYIEDAVFGSGKQVTSKFTDPIDTENYYRFIEFINNVQQSDFHVTRDELYDGESVEYSISSTNNDYKIKTGDSITIRLESIDEGVYDYFRTAGSEGSQSASPDNPISNITNGALGYFSACSYRIYPIIVP
ncbi:DUF4249 domain-containing protein [Maribellus comscasis]|nr:DUF4249 domain-containing protein [Maribellus comscasis]